MAVCGLALALACLSMLLKDYTIYTTHNKKLYSIYIRAREGSNRVTHPVGPVAARPYHEPMYLFV